MLPARSTTKLMMFSTLMMLIATQDIPKLHQSLPTDAANHAFAPVVAGDAALAAAVSLCHIVALSR